MDDAIGAAFLLFWNYVDWWKQNEQTNKVFVCWLLSFDDDIDFFIILLLFTMWPPSFVVIIMFWSDKMKKMEKKNHTFFSIVCIKLDNICLYEYF